jgi:hypothetical protein
MSNLPQIIFSGINLSAMGRDELKAFVVGLDSRAPGADALIQMAFRLDAKLAEAERGLDAWEAAMLADWGRTGVFDEDGRELSEQEAFDEAVAELGIVFDENGIAIAGDFGPFACG